MHEVFENHILIYYDSIWLHAVITYQRTANIGGVVKVMYKGYWNAIIFNFDFKYIFQILYATNLVS